MDEGDEGEGAEKGSEEKRGQGFCSHNRQIGCTAFVCSKAPSLRQYPRSTHDAVLLAMMIIFSTILELGWCRSGYRLQCHPATPAAITSLVLYS